MKSLQSPHVVQLVGICGDAIMTEYHPNGTLGDLIESETYQNFTLLDRIKLAIRYVEILSYLHNSPGTFLNSENSGKAWEPWALCRPTAMLF